MDPVVWLLTVAGAGIAARGIGAIAARGVRAVTARRRWKKLLWVWRDAAAASGVTNLEIRQLGGPRMLEGTWGNLRIQIMEPRQEYVRVVVSGGEQTLEGLSIRPEDKGTGREKLRPEGREIDLGDEAFDAAFYIGGTPAVVHGLLDAPTRRDLLELSAEARVEIRSGEIRLDMHVTGGDVARRPDGLRRPNFALYHVLPVLRGCAERLTAAREIVDHLAANACCDPLTDVRARNLLTLLRELPGLDVTEATLRKACSDPHPEVRLRAASELGSHSVLLALAEGDTEVAARAVSALGVYLGSATAKAMLDRALEADRTDVACACIESLGRHGGPAVVDDLVPLLQHRESDVAVAAATALGSTRAPEVEAPLLAALASHDPRVRIAAAHALGNAGSVDAIPKLKGAIRSQDDELRRTARQAIARIQSRIPPGVAGQLSLASAEAGQLSLAESASGQLSLPEPEVAPARRSE